MKTIHYLIIVVGETTSLLLLVTTCGPLSRASSRAVPSSTFPIVSQARWKPTSRSSKIRKPPTRHTSWLVPVIVPPSLRSAKLCVWNRCIIPGKSKTHQSLTLMSICSLSSTRWDQFACWILWMQQRNKQAKDPRHLGEIAVILLNPVFLPRSLLSLWD